MSHQKQQFKVRTGIRAGQAGIPDVPNAQFQATDNIHEGGVHNFYTSQNAPGNLVNNYQAKLQSEGWTILNSGGDPTGQFGGGLQASMGSSYLSMNAGGPGGQSFIDVCLWPNKPMDTNCGQNNNNNQQFNQNNNNNNPAAGAAWRDFGMSFIP